MSARPVAGAVGHVRLQTKSQKHYEAPESFMLVYKEAVVYSLILFILKTQTKTTEMYRIFLFKINIRYILSILKIYDKIKLY